MRKNLILLLIVFATFDQALYGMQGQAQLLEIKITQAETDNSDAISRSIALQSATLKNMIGDIDAEGMQESLSVLVPFTQNEWQQLRTFLAQKALADKEKDVQSKKEKNDELRKKLGCLDSQNLAQVLHGINFFHIASLKKMFLDSIKESPNFDAMSFSSAALQYNYPASWQHKIVCEVMKKNKISMLYPRQSISISQPALYLYNRFSPRGKHVAFFSQGNIALWDIKDNSIEKPFPVGPEMQANDIVFSPNGRYFACGGNNYDDSLVQHANGFVHLYDIEKKELRMCAAQNGVSSVRFSPDSKTLAVYSGGVVEIRNLYDLACERQITIPEQSFGSLAYLCKGEYLLVGNTIFHARTGNQRKVIKNLPSNVTVDGKYIAGVDGAKVAIWDAATGKQRYELISKKVTQEGDPVGFDQVKFSPDGKYIAAMCGQGQDSSIFIGNICDNNNEEYTHVAHAGNESRNDFVLNKSNIIFKVLRGLEITDIATGQDVVRLDIPKMRSISLSPDGRFLAFFCMDGTAHIIDILPHKSLMLEHLHVILKMQNKLQLTLEEQKVYDALPQYYRQLFA